MFLAKPQRIENRELLDYIKSMPCCIGEGCLGVVDPSHIRTVGARGDDVWWNVVPHCRKHHTEWGQLGWSKFFKRYPHFQGLLEYMGWEIFNGKLIFSRDTASLESAPPPELLQRYPRSQP